MRVCLCTGAHTHTHTHTYIHRVRQADAGAEARAAHPVQGLRHHGVRPDGLRQDRRLPAGAILAHPHPPTHTHTHTLISTRSGMCSLTEIENAGLVLRSR